VIGGDLAASYRDELDPGSVEIVYRGLQDVSLATPESLRRAYGHFEEITRRDPDSSLGYALSAWVHFWAALNEAVDDPGHHYSIAKDFALTAIEHQDTSGMGHMVLAHVLVLEHDWEGAREAASIATAERPSCDVSFGIAASVNRYLGDWEQAIDLASRAIQLSPLMADWYRSIMANAFFVGEDYEIAAETAESIVAEDDTNVEALLTLAAAQAALGRERHASAAIEHARQTAPGLSRDGLRKDLPYRDESTRERFVDHLEEAGLE
jgi:tetratricopeptide (TPR) repeat protein